MPIFVDSNILVYARDPRDTDKQARAEGWLQVLGRQGAGRLSFQVLHEYYVTVTRKLEPGRPVADARQDVRDLLAWRPVPLDARLLEPAWALQDQYGLSYWDALIVAAAGSAVCEHVLTEDLQDGQELAGVRIVNPFRHTPEELLS